MISHLYSAQRFSFIMFVLMQQSKLDVGNWNITKTQFVDKKCLLYFNFYFKSIITNNRFFNSCTEIVLLILNFYLHTY